MNVDYDALGDRYERGDYPGQPGPLFHGLPPDWYLSKIAGGEPISASEVKAAQLESADARIAILENQLLSIRPVVSV